MALPDGSMASYFSRGKLVIQQVTSPAVFHRDDALSYHCAERDNCDCAGDHDCISMQASMAWPGELQERITVKLSFRWASMVTKKSPRGNPDNCVLLAILWTSFCILLVYSRNVNCSVHCTNGRDEQTKPVPRLIAEIYLTYLCLTTRRKALSSHNRRKKQIKSEKKAFRSFFPDFK